MGSVLDTKQNITHVTIDMKTDKNVVQFVHFLFFITVQDVPVANVNCE